MNIHGTASHSIEYKNDRYFTYRKRIIIDGIKRESKWVKTGEFKTIDEAMKEIRTYA